MIAATPDGVVWAFLTWLPYRQGRALLLDAMRRRDNAPASVMDLLIAGQDGQVLGGVGQAQACFFGKGFHRSWPLAQEVQQFQTMRIGQRIADLGEQFIELFFMLPISIDFQRFLHQWYQA